MTPRNIVLGHRIGDPDDKVRQALTAREHTAIVGPSGSGKSTIAQGQTKQLVNTESVMVITTKEDAQSYAVAVQDPQNYLITTVPGRFTHWVDSARILNLVPMITHKVGHLHAELGGIVTMTGEYGVQHYGDEQKLTLAGLFERGPFTTFADWCGKFNAQDDSQTRYAMKQLAETPMLHPQRPEIPRFSFTNWMLSKRLAYVNLTGVPTEVAATIARLIIVQVMIVAEMRKLQGLPTQVNLILDEAQTYWSLALQARQLQMRSLGVKIVLMTQSLTIGTQRRGPSPLDEGFKGSSTRIVLNPDEDMLKHVLEMSGEKIVYDETYGVTYGPNGASYQMGHKPRLTTRLNKNRVIDFLNQKNAFLLLRTGHMPELVKGYWPYTKSEYDRLEACKNVWPVGPSLELPAPVVPMPKGKRAANAAAAEKRIADGVKKRQAKKKMA